MMRCQVDLDCHSPVARSFQLRLVATESTVKRALLRVVLVSASLPKNPMSETRFVKDIAMVSFFCSRCRSGRETASGAAPKAPGLLFRGDRQGVVAPVRQDGGGAETRRAARNERKQKTAVLQGAARPQAVK